MGGPTSVNLPKSVAPGQTVDISINLTAPASGGHYIGYWKFKNASGASSASARPSTSPGGSKSTSRVHRTGVDMTSRPTIALPSWYSIAGNLPCPGTDGNSRGFVLKVDNPQLEERRQ